MSDGETFGQLLHGTGRAWRQKLDERLKPMGLSQAKWRTLMHLSLAQDALTQAEIAARLGVLKPMLFLDGRICFSSCSLPLYSIESTNTGLPRLKPPNHHRDRFLLPKSSQRMCRFTLTKLAPAQRTKPCRYRHRLMGRLWRAIFKRVPM